MKEAMVRRTAREQRVKKSREILGTENQRSRKQIGPKDIYLARADTIIRHTKHKHKNNAALLKILEMCPYIYYAALRIPM